MAKVVFKMNPNFPAEVLRSAEVEVLLREMGERVAERAKRIVEQWDPDEPITVEIIEDHRGKVAQVWNHDWKAWFFEHGTVKMEARPSLRPALEAEGLPPAPVEYGAAD